MQIQPISYEDVSDYQKNLENISELALINVKFFISDF